MNVAIVGFLSTIGTGVLYIAPEAVGNLLSVPSAVAGLITVGLVTGLSIPSVIIIWRSLGTLANLATNGSDDMRPAHEAGEQWRTLRTIVEYGLATVLLALLFLLTLPLFIRLVTLNSLSIPLSLILLLSPALAVGIFSFRIQSILEQAITDVFVSKPDSPEEDSEGGEEDNL